MLILFITEAILHFPFPYSFKDKAENLFPCILYVRCIFNIIVFNPGPPSNAPSPVLLSSDSLRACRRRVP